VRSVLRRQDLLASEAQSRVWVIARDTARPGARALADRIAAAVGEVEGLHGAPLTVNVGLAVLGEDARDCSSLLEAAEEAAFTAAAAGDRVAEYLPQSRSGEPPGTD
jgi:GGDEF domain-containing protein